MHRRGFVYVFLIFILLYSQKAVCQEDPLVQSYRYYISQNWDSLYTQRKVLLERGDSYYLRYRLAEASWNKEDYRMATVDFGKAHRFNSTDTFSLLFLRNCLLAQGKLPESIWLNRALKKAGSNSLIKRSSNHFSFLESGYRISNLREIGNLSYFHAGLNFQLSHNLSAYFGWSKLQQDLALPDGSVYLGINQSNILGKLRWQLREDLQLQPFAGLLDVQLRFNNNATNYDQYQFVGFQCGKSWEKFDAESEVSYANFYLGDQLNFGLQGTFYPGIRRSTAIGLGLMYQTDSGVSGSALKIQLRQRIGRRLWISADGYTGNLYNQIEDVGYLPNNSPDLTMLRLRSILSYFPSAKWSVYLTGSYEKREEYLDGFLYNLMSVYLGVKINPFAQKSLR